MTTPQKLVPSVQRAIEPCYNPYYFRSPSSGHVLTITHHVEANYLCRKTRGKQGLPFRSDPTDLLSSRLGLCFGSKAHANLFYSLFSHIHSSSEVVPGNMARKWPDRCTSLPAWIPPSRRIGLLPYQRRPTSRCDLFESPGSLPTDDYASCSSIGKTWQEVSRHPCRARAWVYEPM